MTVPFLFNYYVTEGLALKAGLQPGFPLRQVYDYEATSNVSNLRQVDFSIPVGLSYAWEHWLVDIRYNIGVSNVFRQEVKPKNSVFAITCGYRF